VTKRNSIDNFEKNLGVQLMNESARSFDSTLHHLLTFLRIQVMPELKSPLDFCLQMKEADQNAFCYQSLVLLVYYILTVSEGRAWQILSPYSNIPKVSQEEFVSEVEVASERANIRVPF
jgi:hypothetical protein